MFGRRKKQSSLGEGKTLRLPEFLPEFTAPLPPALAPNFDEPFFVQSVVFDPNEISNFTEFSAALSSDTVQLTLASDLIVPETISLDHDVAINLNGHSIIFEPLLAVDASSSLSPAPLFEIRHGEVTLTGAGKLFAMPENSVLVRLFGAINPGLGDFTALTVDENVHLYAPSGTAIQIAPNLGVAYGIKINFAGEIIARLGINMTETVPSDESNLPQIHLKSGSRIIADEESGLAISAAGPARWQLDLTRFYGRAGIYAAAGHFRFAGAEILTDLTCLETPYASTSPVTLDFVSGKFLSEAGLTFIGYPSAIKEFAIKDGLYSGASGVINPDLVNQITITGGDFTKSPSDALPEFTLIVNDPEFAPDFGRCYLIDENTPVTFAAKPSRRLKILRRRAAKRAAREHAHAC